MRYICSSDGVASAKEVKDEVLGWLRPFPLTHPDDLAVELCNICVSINWHPLLLDCCNDESWWEPPLGAAYRSVHIPSFRRMKKRASHCAFCRLCTKFLKVYHPDLVEDTDEESGSDLSEDDEEGFNSEYPASDSSYFDETDASSSGASMESLTYYAVNLKYSSYERSLNTRERAVYERLEDSGFRLIVGDQSDELVPDIENFQFMPAAEDVPLHRKRRAGQRILSSAADPTLFKRWYEACKKDHGNGCGARHPELPSADWSRVFDHFNFGFQFRLIDVRKRRIVEAPQGCSYVALSYVWGGLPNIYRARKCDMKFSCEEPRGFYIDLPDNGIPKTVQQAMRVTEMLGESYCWVDALCIVQDDPEELTAVIGAMDAIYTLASVTICAIAGRNADSGLPGLLENSRNTQQLCEQVAGITLFSVSPSLSKVQNSSVWNKRAWTYQEKYFSNRCLIFSEDYVYFRCRQLETCEDLVDLDNETQSYFIDSEHSKAVWLRASNHSSHHDVCEYNTLSRKTGPWFTASSGWGSCEGSATESTDSNGGRVIEQRSGRDWDSEVNIIPSDTKNLRQGYSSSEGEVSTGNGEQDTRPASGKYHLQRILEQRNRHEFDNLGWIDLATSVINLSSDTLSSNDRTTPYMQRQCYSLPDLSRFEQVSQDVEWGSDTDMMLSYAENIKQEYSSSESEVSAVDGQQSPPRPTSREYHLHRMSEQRKRHEFDNLEWVDLATSLTNLKSRNLSADDRTMPHLQRRSSLPASPCFEQVPYIADSPKEENDKDGYEFGFWVPRSTFFKKPERSEEEQLKFYQAVEKFYEGADKSLRRSFAEYVETLTEYTKRSLTNQSDILNGYRGIMNDIERRMKKRFHYGLPIACFDDALLWKHPDDLYTSDWTQIWSARPGHFHESDNGLGLDYIRSAKSWKWVHSLEYHKKERKIREKRSGMRGKKILSRFQGGSADDAEKFPSWSWCGWKGPIGYASPDILLPEIEWPWQRQDPEESKPTSSFGDQVLHVEAWTAKVNMQKVRRHFLHNASNPAVFWGWPVEDGKRLRTGMHKCVLLSRSPGSADPTFDFTCPLNVMVVKCDDVTGVLYRRGIGQIHEKDWQDFHPVKEWICLG